MTYGAFDHKKTDSCIMNIIFTFYTKKNSISSMKNHKLNGT